jgi:NAD-dependent deacetylase
MNDKIQELKKLIQQSKNIVFFGGAGVSTESGIPDFRSKDGLYNQQYDYPPEEILSHTFFMNNTEEFYKFYKAKMNSLKYKPNITHKKLAELEDSGKLKAVVTQNIDGLHQRAGSKTVYELHGSVLRNYCMDCGKFYNAEYVFNSKDIPKCSCGGIIKPDVVLYEEQLDDTTIKK